jgi:CRISPR-associated protein Csx14
MGNSPPVVTEFVDYTAKEETIRNCVILSTEAQQVEESTTIAAYALQRRFPKIRCYIVSIPFEDIQSTSDTIEFMRLCARVIREERERYRAQKIYLNIAGGRKNMSIIMVLLGQMLGVNGVFHVINRNVQVFNERLERLRYIIAQIHSTPNDNRRAEIYETHVRELEELMFPSISDYSVIRLPILPYPLEYLGEIIKVLKSNFTITTETKLKPRELEQLKTCGFIKLRRNRIIPTETGKELAKLF